MEAPMASDQFNVNVRITGANDAEVRESVAASLRSTHANVTAAPTAAMQRDVQNAATMAAREIGRSVRYQANVPMFDNEGNVTGVARMQARGLSRRDEITERVSVRNAAHETSGIMERARMEARMAFIVNPDRLGGAHRPGSIEAHVREVEADPMAIHAKSMVGAAKANARKVSQGVAREVKRGHLVEDRDEVVARAAAARVGVDLSRMSLRVRAYVQRLDRLEREVGGFEREELDTQEGRKRLKQLSKATGVLEGEQRRQSSQDAAAARRDDQAAARTRRQAALFSTAGTVAGMHALSTGVVNAAGQVMSGNLMQVPGTLLNAGGSWLQRTGAGQMAAARTAMASSAAAAAGTGAGASAGAGAGGGGGILGGVGGMAGLAGGGLALVGTAVMALGKVITAGLERGYKNSETADRFMADAEPYFDRQAREYNVAHGSYATRGYNGARFIDGGKVTGYDGGAARAKYAGIVDRLGEGGQRYVPRSSQAGDRHEVGYQDDISGLGIAPGDEGRVRTALQREQRRVHRGEVLQTDSDITKLRAAVQHAKASNDPDARKYADQLKEGMVAKLTKYGDPGHATRKDQEKRAENSLTSLYALSAMGMGPAEALKAYQSFRGGRGNARGSISEDVALMMNAMKAGLPMDLQSSAMRLTDIVGGATHAPTAMARSLTRYAGLQGDPQHKVIGSIYEQMAGEEARGFTPNANVAANSMDVMLEHAPGEKGIRYSTVPRVRQTISEMVQSNANPLKEAGMSMIKHMLKVNSFAKGRSLKEGQLYEHETDPMVQMAEMMAAMQEGDARDLMMNALSPTESKQLDAAMKKMGGTDLKASPEDNKELQNGDGIFDRYRAMLAPMWNLIGKHRNVEAIEASSKFTSALDEAANALRSAADVGLTLASKFAFAEDD